MAAGGGLPDPAHRAPWGLATGLGNRRVHLIRHPNRHWEVPCDFSLVIKPRKGLIAQLWEFRGLSFVCPLKATTNSVLRCPMVPSRIRTSHVELQLHKVAQRVGAPTPLLDALQLCTLKRVNRRRPRHPRFAWQSKAPDKRKAEHTPPKKYPTKLFIHRLWFSKLRTNMAARKWVTPNKHSPRHLAGPGI